MAKILILLLKLDNFDNEKGRVWPNALNNVLQLITQAKSESQGKLYFRFLLRAMLTFDEEVVERSETKSLVEHRISN